MTGSERRVVLWGELPRVVPLKRNGVTDLGGWLVRGGGRSKERERGENS